MVCFTVPINMEGYTMILCLMDGRDLVQIIEKKSMGPLSKFLQATEAPHYACWGDVYKRQAQYRVVPRNTFVPKAEKIVGKQ